jgi:hypothetical protein
LPAGVDQIYLFHIRKTGGTSLVRSFLSLGGEDPATVENRLAASFLSRTKSRGFVFSTVPTSRYFFGWAHTASHRFRLPVHAFTVSLFRDPAARVISYYRYLVGGDSDPGMAWRVQQDERALARDGFDSFLDRIPRELLLNQLYMFSSRFDVSEAVTRIQACSAVLTLENYSRDLEKLASTLGLPLTPRIERVTNGPSAAITDDQRHRLRQALTDEYAMLSRVGIAFE